MNKKTYRMVRGACPMFRALPAWVCHEFTLCCDGVDALVEIPPDVNRIELVTSTRPLNQQSLEVTLDRSNGITYVVDGRDEDMPLFPGTMIRYKLGFPEKFYATIYYGEEA